MSCEPRSTTTNGLHPNRAHLKHELLPIAPNSNSFPVVDETSVKGPHPEGPSPRPQSTACFPQGSIFRAPHRNSVTARSRTMQLGVGDDITVCLLYAFNDTKRRGDTISTLLLRSIGHHDRIDPGGSSADQVLIHVSSLVSQIPRVLYSSVPGHSFLMLWRSPRPPVQPYGVD